MSIFRKRAQRTIHQEFQTAYELLERNPPLDHDGTFDFDRASKLLGDYRYPSPQSFACEWYDDGLRDSAPSGKHGNISSRVNRIWLSFLLIDAIPEAAGLVVDLAQSRCMTTANSQNPTMNELIADLLCNPSRSVSWMHMSRVPEGLLLSLRSPPMHAASTTTARVNGPMQRSEG